MYSINKPKIPSKAIHNIVVSTMANMTKRKQVVQFLRDFLIIITKNESKFSMVPTISKKGAP